MLEFTIYTDNEDVEVTIKEAIEKLEKMLAQFSKPELPKNHGKPWTQDLDWRLLELLVDDDSLIDDIANRMGRTPYAIECRLNHLVPNVKWQEYIGQGPGSAQKESVDFWDDFSTTEW